MKVFIDGDNLVIVKKADDHELLENVSEEILKKIGEDEFAIIVEKKELLRAIFSTEVALSRPVTPGTPLTIEMHPMLVNVIGDEVVKS